MNCHSKKSIEAAMGMNCVLLLILITSKVLHELKSRIHLLVWTCTWVYVGAPGNTRLAPINCHDGTSNTSSKCQAWDMNSFSPRKLSCLDGDAGIILQKYILSQGSTGNVRDILKKSL